MTRGSFIKHKKYRDVCCLIVKSFYVENRYKLKIQFWNQGFEKSWNLGITQNIEISNEDKKNWLWTNDQIVCLRNANWISL